MVGVGSNFCFDCWTVADSALEALDVYRFVADGKIGKLDLFNLCPKSFYICVWGSFWFWVVELKRLETDVLV